MPQLAGVSLAVVDIALPNAVSPDVFESLGPRIPVLAASSTDPARFDEQLSWPFTAQQVVQLLARQNPA